MERIKRENGYGKPVDDFYVSSGKKEGDDL